MKNFIYFLMKEGEANSRFVFLLHGIATAVGILMLSCMFPFVKDRTGFPVMVGAIGGGGVGAAIGRFFTKWGDGKQEQSDPSKSSPQ